jgi:hypothetical protein
VSVQSPRDVGIEVGVVVEVGVDGTVDVEVGLGVKVTTSSLAHVGTNRRGAIDGPTIDHRLTNG